MKIKKGDIFVIVWLLLFSALAIVLTIIQKDTLFGFSVFISGVFCVVLAAKGNIWTYVFGMYNSLSYAYLAFTNGLYGEMGLNLLFFVPMNILGFILWKRNMTDNRVKMRGLKMKMRIIFSVASLFGIFGLGFLLSRIKGQNSPYIDATTNILSITATLLMVWRYKEQWLLYIILNVFTVLMWIIRLINGSPDGAIMIIMWTAYLINAIYGFYNWSIGSVSPKEEK